jgi:hypothetical protein
MAHGRPLVRSIDLRELLVLPLPLTGVPDTEAIRKDLADVLERHTPDLWKAEDDEHPAEEADSSVEAERARRSDALHHRQEGGCNDDIGGPACDGIQHGADRANLLKKELV